jgi:integrative and conjugative element protein (TIGR02256 family)
MPYHREWIVSSNGILMVMSESVVLTFSKYAQDSFIKTESGGILLGKRRHDHFEILQVTTPTEFDKRARTHWTRSEEIHSDIAKKTWQDSSGEISYLGEWHTHPEITPSPSVIDMNEWSILSNSHHHKAGLTMIIVGIKDIWCGVAKKDSLTPLIKVN